MSSSFDFPAFFYMNKFIDKYMLCNYDDKYCSDKMVRFKNFYGFYPLSRNEIRLDKILVLFKAKLTLGKPDLESLMRNAMWAYNWGFVTSQELGKREESLFSYYFKDLLITSDYKPCKDQTNLEQNLELCKEDMDQYGYLSFPDLEFCFGHKLQNWLNERNPQSSTYVFKQLKQVQEIGYRNQDFEAMLIIVRISLLARSSHVLLNLPIRGTYLGG